MLCPLYLLSERQEFGSKDKRESLRQGRYVGYHLLNRYEGDDIEGFSDYLIVDFRNAFSLPIEFLINLVNSQPSRLRLLPPYREHLSQAFARFFMRVGLPIDIPPFK